ncbi:hypothetical protein niasHT_016333 [Heterodera trifolii]|uniref:Glycine-rich protein n=1 Tax=Heterodera trifolii TaxID=157864 RepID=A0ABD2KYU0_9BILA
MPKTSHILLVCLLFFTTFLIKTEAKIEEKISLERNPSAERTEGKPSTRSKRYGWGYGGCCCCGGWGYGGYGGYGGYSGYGGYGGYGPFGVGLVGLTGGLLFGGWGK